MRVTSPSDRLLCRTRHWTVHADGQGRQRRRLGRVDGRHRHHDLEQRGWTCVPVAVAVAIAIAITSASATHLRHRWAATVTSAVSLCGQGSVCQALHVVCAWPEPVMHCAPFDTMSTLKSALPRAHAGMMPQSIAKAACMPKALDTWHAASPHTEPGICSVLTIPCSVRCSVRPSDERCHAAHLPAAHQRIRRAHAADAARRHSCTLRRRCPHLVGSSTPRRRGPAKPRRRAA